MGFWSFFKRKPVDIEFQSDEEIFEQVLREMEEEDDAASESEGGSPYWRALQQELPMTRELMTQIVIDLASPLSPARIFEQQGLVMVGGDGMFGPFSSWQECEAVVDQFEKEAPLEWLDILIDLVRNRPDFSQYNDGINEDWDYYLPQLLAGVSGRDPQQWMAKVGPLLNETTERRLVLDALGRAAPKDGLPWLEPFLRDWSALSEQELEELASALFECDPEAPSRLKAWKENVPAGERRLLRIIDNTLDPRPPGQK